MKFIFIFSFSRILFFYEFQALPSKRCCKIHIHIIEWCLLVEVTCHKFCKKNSSACWSTLWEDLYRWLWIPYQTKNTAPKHCSFHLPGFIAVQLATKTWELERKQFYGKDGQHDVSLLILTYVFLTDLMENHSPSYRYH